MTHVSLLAWTLGQLNLPGSTHHLPFVDVLPLLVEVPITHAPTQTPVISWVFSQAQAVLCFLPVPYVWGILLTELLNVMPQLSGMGPTRPLPNRFKVNYCYAKTTNPSAPIGNTKEVAPANITTNNIFALDAVRLTTELRKLKVESLPTNQTFGSDCSLMLASFTSTPMSPLIFVLVLSSSFPLLHLPKPHLIIPLSLSLSPNSWRLYEMSLEKDHTLGHYPESMSNPSLGPSKLCPSPSSQSLPKSAGFESSKTILSPTKCPSCIQTLLSIPLLTPITFPPLGGLSPTLSFCFIIFHLVCRLPLGTLQDYSPTSFTVASCHHSSWQRQFCYQHLAVLWMLTFSRDIW